MKALIAYYSKTGKSEKAAKALAEHLMSNGHKATIEQIVPKSGYTIIMAYTLGCIQARRRHVVELNSPVNNPSEFDLIAVISPTWAFTCAPPAYSFVSNLLQAKKGQKAIAITLNAGTPGDGPKRLADVLRAKGYKVVAEFTTKEPGSVGKTVGTSV